MTGGQFPRASAILGIRVDSGPPFDVFQRLIDEATVEDSDLEFKRQFWDAGDDGSAELAKDIAALANGGGGVIIVGIAESRGRASQVQPVPIGDDKRRHVMSVASSRIFPMPDVDVLQVADPNDPGQGVLVVLVPRSHLAPHAVVRPAARSDLAYPVRSGSRTRYLTESEVADRYRARFLFGTRATDDIRNVHERTLTRLDRGRVWLVISTAPMEDGHIPLHGDIVEETQRWARDTHHRLPPIFSELQLGSSDLRVDVRSVRTTTTRATRPFVELYRNGSSGSAVPLSDGRDQVQTVAELDLLRSVVAMVHLAAGHAARAGAHGEALLRIDLVQMPSQASQLRGPTPAYSLGGGTMFFDDTRGEPSMDSVTLDAFISMDESQTPVGLVSACLPLVMEILTTYSVADTMLFGADGLHLSAWPPNERARIERWLTPSSA